jgi:[acyl-carrier-protein] S-malonyltransferase
LTTNGQPALLTVSYILYHLLEIEPVIAAGHSLGEYSALLCAGALKFEDAVLLVHKRGKYMQEAVPVGEGAMAAVMGADIEVIKQALSEVEGVVNLANRNGSTQVVISGEKTAVEQAVKKIPSAKIKFLPVSAPFHSELMIPAEDKLSLDLDEIEFNDLKFPVLNNISASEVTTGDHARYSLKKQVSRPVLWHDTVIKLLGEKGIRKFAEIGSGKVLSGLLKRTARELAIDIEQFNIQKLEDLQAVYKN